MLITKEFVASVRGCIAENPAMLTSRLAADLHSSEASVVMALPRAMRLRADNAKFSAIWETASRWEKAQERLPDEQQLKEQLGSIWFVSRPLPEGDSHSVCFFDKTGDQIFSISIGLDSSGEPLPAEKAQYDALRERFGVVPTPPSRCCGGGGGGCGCARTGGCRHNHEDEYAVQ